MSIRKIILAILMALLVVTAVSGKGETEKSTDDTVTVKFFHRFPEVENMAYFDQVIAMFEEENPGIEVISQGVANDPFKEKIKIVLGTDSAPDVFFTWPGEFTNRFIRANKVLDISEYLERDGWLDSLVDSQMEPFKYNDRYYGIPFRVNGKIFVYNKNIFNEAGVSVPANFDEFLDVCDKIQQSGHLPISLGNQAPWAISHYIGTMNQKMMKWDELQDGYAIEVSDYSNSGWVESLESFRDLSQYINTDANSLKHGEAKNSFLLGNAAMMYLEIMELPFIEKNAPAEFRENYGVFVFPEMNGSGNQNYLTGYPEGFVVHSETKNPDEAVQFLKYLTGPEAGLAEAKKLGWINGVKNVAGKDDVAPVIYDTVQIVLNSEKMVNWMDSGLNQQVWNIYGSELQKLLDGVSTPQQVIDRVQTAANEIK